jgi:hypothetical protein
MRNDVKQARTKGDKEQNYQQPSVYKPSLIMVGRRSGNAKNKMDSAKDRSEELYQFILSEF